MTLYFDWQERYTEALLELDRVQLPQRIAAAEKAIHERIEQLKLNNTGSVEELWAINDALRGLRVLAKSEFPEQRLQKADAPQAEAAS